MHISYSILGVWKFPFRNIPFQPSEDTDALLSELPPLSHNVVRAADPSQIRKDGSLCPQSHACRLEWSHPLSPCCVQLRLILDARVPIFKMFHPSSNTARTHAHTSISTLKSLVNFCSRDFLFNEKFDDSTLAKRHIIVGHFVRSDTGHVMQAIDVTRHWRITQQLVPSTTILSFVCCSRFACKNVCFWLSVWPSY